MKHFLKICVVLTLVCTLMATALALINGVTAPLIRKNETEKRAEILEAFFPEMEGEYEVFDSAVDGVACIYAVRGAENTLLGYCAEDSVCHLLGNYNENVLYLIECRLDVFHTPVTVASVKPALVRRVRSAETVPSSRDS